MTDTPRTLKEERMGQTVYEYLFAGAVKFIQQRYPEWNGTADGSQITLCGCANMVAAFVYDREAVDREAQREQRHRFENGRCLHCGTEYTPWEREHGECKLANPATGERPTKQFTTERREAHVAAFLAMKDEQRCPEILTKEGDRCAGKAGHDGPHELDLTAASDAEEGEMSEGKYDEATSHPETRNDVPDAVLRATALELERPDGVYTVAEKRREGESNRAYADRLRQEVERLKRQ